MVDPAYEVHAIPSAPTEHDIVRYKHLRLQALQNDPQSFSSTYEREVAMSDEEWKARLHSTNKVTIVATSASNGGSGLEMLALANEWVGTVTVLGPNFLRQHGFVPPKSIRSVEGIGDCYIFVGVWVHPSHRGKGLGKRLVGAGMDWARAGDRFELTDKRILLLEVTPESKSAISLYSSLGFRPVETDSDAGNDRNMWMVLEIA